uniref:Uncharacterized protein n=1 Tax=Anguilla anguilla TaxID=7936 RepID=A0A0E9RIK7_ANGAN
MEQLQPLVCRRLRQGHGYRRPASHKSALEQPSFDPLSYKFCARLLPKLLSLLSFLRTILLFTLSFWGNILLLLCAMTITTIFTYLPLSVSSKTLLSQLLKPGIGNGLL